MKTRYSYLAIAAATVFVLATGVSGVRAEMMSLKATLSAAQEVPATNSAGTGTATLTFDTVSRKLDYEVTYSGLSGPATGAHIHMPAAVGANAGVAIPFASPASPIKGSATLTEGQTDDLLGGRSYVNVHTAANAGGEIRGQITR
ncbi:MAG: CHRD domain-containing protein [Alphaproteobacteria bacterium]|nr:CHRD domain-containing protein [Alphaproteobacteria bacterium]